MTRILFALVFVVLASPAFASSQTIGANPLGALTPLNGAACDGVTDAGAALASAALVHGHVYIPRGCTVRIAVATTIAAPLFVAGGGLLKVDKVAVTLSGPVQAGASERIFAFVGAGAISFTNNQTRWPEWFGAVPNDPAADNTAAINAAVAAGPGNVLLVAPSYYHAKSITISTPKTHVLGVGDQATSLFLTSGTADQVIVGKPTNGATVLPTSAPMPLYGSLENLLLVRAVAPTSGLGSFPFTGAAKGVNIGHVINFTINNVHTYRSRIGFYERNTADVRMVGRPIAEFNFSLDGGDFIGFYIDGQDDPYPGTGVLANASTRIVDAFVYCNSATPASADSAAYLVTGNFSDQFFTNPESAGGCPGVHIDGTGATTRHVNRAGPIVGAEIASFTLDVHFSNPIMDGCSHFCILIEHIPASTSAVSFEGGYVEAATARGIPLVRVDGANGVSFSGMHFMCWPDASSGNVGFFARNARQIALDSTNHLLGCGQPVYLTAVVASEIAPVIQNFDERSANRAAVTSIAGANNNIHPSVDCVATTVGNSVDALSGCFLSALETDGASTDNSVNLSKVIPRAVTTIWSHNGAAVKGHFGTSIGANNVNYGSQP